MDDIRRPKSYSLVKMLPLMLLLGFVGTLSDVLFFATFYRTSPDMFRSLWFVLNILSDIALIYSIRTSKFFLRATRPSWLLMGASLCSVIICIWLPYSQIGHAWFSFVSPAVIDMIKVFGIVIVYAFMTEWAKIQYYRYIAKQNNHANVQN
jgi:Mg2+-importing ATPase